MKQKVYIDTSVAGGCFDKEFKEWSIALFDEFKKGVKIMVLSDLALQELEAAPKDVRGVLDIVPSENKQSILLNDDAVNLAEAYIKEKAISQKYFNDALHIAIATINRIDVLASWNFKHIVNLNRIRLYNAVNLKNGYQVIEIRTPREILNS